MKIRKSTSGSVLVLLLFWIMLLSSLLFFEAQISSLEQTTTHSFSSSYEASLAVTSGLAAATERLRKITTFSPAFVVTLVKQSAISQKILAIEESNSSSLQSPLLLISGTPVTLKNKATPKVDLNKKGHSIASTGIDEAPWVLLTDRAGNVWGRYAFLFLDEQARLNPLFHHGTARNDPLNWDLGATAMPLSLPKPLLLTLEEATCANAIAPTIKTMEGWESLFENRAAYEAQKNNLSLATEPVADVIPDSLPEGGKPKYNLNDLATNPIWGATPSNRASTIAMIIDRNFPHFKERDPSLSKSTPQEQLCYLNRLAACIVDYISPDLTPTLVNEGEPAGQSLTPLLTQIAERIALLERTSNSVTVENQYFLQVWNPYTTPIPAGSIARFSISNRQRLHFGTAPPCPFDDYLQTSSFLPTLHPNESKVIAFPSVRQTWNSPTEVLKEKFPYWDRGPSGNADPTRHQPFAFFWNDALITKSRQAPLGSGLAEGGLEHDEHSLMDKRNVWQCNFIPTEKDASGHFRFVGDPRENYLINYLWKAYSSDKSYLENTRWQGVMSDASSERLFSPATTWLHRDFVPINPMAGNHPFSLDQTPDQIASSYQASEALFAPFVLRKGPMNSIVELGHICDPAQADDLGNAPLAGANEGKSSFYASGGGRTLRIGQPEFPYWDHPGMRAIDLLDLFTVTNTANTTAGVVPFFSKKQEKPTSCLLRQGLLNVNTASHAVLTALFYGITPTSDQRFTHSSIGLEKAEKLATLLEQHRPYRKLSDLAILTPELANATTYTPPLAYNVPGETPPLAAVLDRAREEGFGKMISLCTVQSHAFRIYVLGESLNKKGQTTGEHLLEATLVLRPKKRDNNSYFEELIPVIEKREWLR